MVMRVGYRFQPTPEELVNYFLKEKRRDPDFTDPDIKEVNIYKHHPCELPGLSSYQSDDQVWYFFCSLDYKYAESDRARRTAKGGSWKKTGIDRPVKAKDSNKPIGIKKTLVFYKGRDFRKENKTNWTMHEFHEYPSKKNPLFKGQVVICRIERKPDKKHEASSALDEVQPSDSDSGNNVAQDIPEIETQLYQESQTILPNYIEEEYDISFDKESQAILPNHIGESQTILPNLIEQEDQCRYSQWDVQNEFYGKEARQSHPLESQAILPNHIGESQAILPRESQAILPNFIEQEDQCRYSQWDVQNEFYGKEAGQSHPLDLKSSNLVTGAYVCDGNDAEAVEIAALLNEFWQ
ncbi:hypothetical protein EZV62_022899 [Acer yangbiense]|uniref:NAC domain-containing protein n=1 Tax=Acer yangbiense TaxID=1000413 RepID=A0A5C7H0T8_9ROSI|nr:hypothetical protein EZV62_022899 [Acer yangbiense]